MTPEPRTVFTLCAGSQPRSRHERASQAWVARRLASILGWRFGGEYDARRSPPGARYFVPDETLTAAQSGARVARTQPVGGGWQDAAVAKATGDIDHIGPHLISGLHVDTGEVNDERWVQVSGEAVQVIPFLTFHVSQRSQGPIECFRPDVGTGLACQRGAGP